MRIAVAGGSGTVGRYVVQAACLAGHEAVVMSRRAGVDVRTGEGLPAALRGVEVIIDTANSGTMSRAKATAFFTHVTDNLQSVGMAQGVSRLVTLSIVGLERLPGFGYYEAKLAQEAAALAGPLSVSIVRATQFHEFPLQILSRSRFGPVALVPIMRIQPVSARAIGELLLEIAVGTSLGTTLEVGGPEEKDLVSLARSVVRKWGMRTSVVPLPVPGRAGRAMRAGGQLPQSRARIVGPTFEEWLKGADVLSMGT
jgi:uncharacterized protein YbjT (DUF2867 family)